MGTLQQLNTLISEELAAAAAEIFGAVEKTLTGYQREMSRSKQEIDHLRSLLVSLEVRLHRSENLNDERYLPLEYIYVFFVESLEVIHCEQEWPDEQQHTKPNRCPCQDHKDLDPPQVKMEKATSSSPKEENDNEYDLSLQSERRSYAEPHASSPTYDQTLCNTTLHTAEEMRRDAEGEGCRLSRPPGSVDKFSIRVTEDVNDLTRERRHTCPICAKCFKESSHLKDHVRIHTGEKPYQCKECGKNFRQSGALTLHMRIHTGERPYQCTDCGRRFNRKGDMETHRVTHTEERPHLCLDQQ
uniref:C2H2-type domain-containing protein n=1 Tax=Monopterus albus TaxID=43700 RepID=A0A3Q3Q4F8_MONAL